MAGTGEHFLHGGCFLANLPEKAEDLALIGDAPDGRLNPSLAGEFFPGEVESRNGQSASPELQPVRDPDSCGWEGALELPEGLSKELPGPARCICHTPVSLLSQACTCPRRSSRLISLVA